MSIFTIEIKRFPSLKIKGPPNHFLIQFQTASAELNLLEAKHVHSLLRETASKIRYNNLPIRLGS